MIRRGFAQGQAEEFFKGQPVIDLVFEFRIGIDAEPLLQQYAFEQQQWWIGIGAFPTGTDGIAPLKWIQFSAIQLIYPVYS